MRKQGDIIKGRPLRRERARRETPRRLRLGAAAARAARVLALAAGATLTLTGCIDEDLSKCGKEYSLRYVVHRNTEQYQEELKEQLSTADEQAIGALLREALTPVFADEMHDLDLSFYNATGLAHADSCATTGLETTFDFYLPADGYMHHAAANVGTEAHIALTGADDRTAHALRRLTGADTESHSHGLYAGQIEIAAEPEEEDGGPLTVDLYMTNCATALVLYLDGHRFDAIETYATGFAESFGLEPLGYQFDTGYRVKALPLSDGAERVAFYSVQLPSGGWSRSDGQWQMEVYVRHGDSTTKNTLTSTQPVNAGELRVLKGKLTADGSITVGNPNVAVAVTLDWKQGSEWDVNM